jgi:hypothetical protein
VEIAVVIRSHARGEKSLRGKPNRLVVLRDLGTIESLVYSWIESKLVLQSARTQMHSIPFPARLGTHSSRGKVADAGPAQGRARRRRGVRGQVRRRGRCPIRKRLIGGQSSSW